MPFAGIGLNMDLRRMIVSVGSRTGSAAGEAATLMLSSATSSALEGEIFEMAQSVTATSTVNLIAKANAERVPLGLVNAGNAAQAVSRLDLPAEHRAAIAADAQAGRTVVATGRVLTTGDWTGAAWASIDPATGASA
ncbi:hypothetical protein Acor_36720 [Acrocarpospora corrugata]|uniref:Uncharacterized protein n=1 Tax=Acrocarpospora corrugata TaxID=35763 RepID=A0A5M3W4Y9_9ACTN|nr:hypothetical protein [Acrocarpospora corrugata]GES01608.1 hypothetical protein Acor_36720 [Acrocarpospora corrugata]